MPTVSVETLKEQLQSSQADVENSRITLHRAEGMVILLNHLIALVSEPTSPSEPPSEIEV